MEWNLEDGTRQITHAHAPMRKDSHDYLSELHETESCNLPGTLEADGESYTQERVFGREQRLDMTVYWWQHYRTHDADTRSDVAPCSNYCCKSRGLECTSLMIHGAEND